MPSLCPDVAANPLTRCCNNAVRASPTWIQPCIAVVQNGISLVIPSTLSCCSGTLTWGLPELQKTLLRAASSAAANYLNSRGVNYKGNTSKVTSDLMQAGKLPPVNIQDTEQKPWQQYWWKIPFPHGNAWPTTATAWSRNETGMRELEWHCCNCPLWLSGLRQWLHASYLQQRQYEKFLGYSFIPPLTT